MELERIVVRLVADATQYLGPMRAARGELEAFGGVARRVHMAMVETARSALSLAVDYERAGVAFEVMAGSAEKGRAVLRDINKLAVESPFQSGKLIEQAKQLAAFSFAPDQIVPTLRVLGDASAATGTDLSRLTLALGQVNVVGRLMGQELRQFTNAGVPLIKYLALAMGEAEDRIPGLVRQGRVGFNDVAKALNLMTAEGGLFHGMMQRINRETVYGRWQNFVETLQMTARNMAGAAMTAAGLREGLTSLTAALNGMTEERAADVFNTLAARGREAVAVLRAFGEASGLSASGGLDQTAAWVRDNRELVGTLIAAATALAAVRVAATLAGVALAGLGAVGRVAFGPLGLTLAGIAAALAVVDELAGGGLFAGLASGDLTAVRTAAVTAAAAFKQVVDVVRQLTGGGEALGRMFTDLFDGVRKQGAEAVRFLLQWEAGMWALVGAVTALTVAFVTVKAVTAAWGVVMGVVTALTAVFWALTTPLGIAAMVGAALLVVLQQLGAMDHIFDWMNDSSFASAMGAVKDAFTQVVELVKAGELEEAFRLAAKAVGVVWDHLLLGLEMSWVRFVGNLRKMFALQGGSVFDDVFKAMHDFDALMKKYLTIQPWGEIEDERAQAYRALDSRSASHQAAVDAETKAKLDAIMARMQTNPGAADLRAATAMTRQLARLPQGPPRDAMRALSRFGAGDQYDAGRFPQLLADLGLDKVSGRQIENLLTEARNTAGLPPAVRRLVESMADQDGVNPNGPFVEYADRVALAALDTSEALVKDYERLQKAVKDGLPEAEIKAARDQFTARVNTIPGILADVEKVRKAVDEAVNGRIDVVPRVSPDTLAYIQDLERDVKRRDTPMDMFEKHMGFLAEALGGPKGVGPFGAVGGGAMMAAAFKGIIPKDLFDEGSFREYEALRRAVQSRLPDRIAPTAMIGTTAAQDVISRNQGLSADGRDEVLDTLREANRQRQEQTEYQKKVIEALEGLRGKDGTVGGFKGG